MKRNNTILTVYVLLISTISLQAADTLKIHLTYKHNLDESGHSLGFTTVKQQFYTPSDTFFREINYNESTGQISNYIFRFYRDGRIFTEECHDSKDNLLYITKHEYDRSGNETVISKLVPSGKGFATEERMVRKFDGNHQAISCKKYYGKKSGMIVQYKYDISGHLVMEKTVFKQIANADVKQEVKEYSHSDNGSIKQIDISGSDNTGKPFSYSQSFTYDEKGLLTSLKQFNQDGSLWFEKIYKYLKSGTPSFYEEHDSAGKLILLLQYDYKKHNMEKGIQVSKYENL